MNNVALFNGVPGNSSKSSEMSFHHLKYLQEEEVVALPSYHTVILHNFESVGLPTEELL